MLKKTMYIGGGAVAVLALVFGRDTVSYVRTTASWVRETARDSVPLEFKIENARKMIAHLEPEIRKNRHRIAMEEVGVERLAKQIERLEGRTDDSRDRIGRLRDHLESGKETFRIRERTYTVSEVKSNLAHWFQRLKTNENSLDVLHRTLNSRQKYLNAARRQLDNMLAERRSLMVEIENIEARHKMNQVAQTVSELNFDDSQLARTKEQLALIDAQIRVNEKLVDSGLDFQEEIPLDDVDTGDLLEEIAQYLGPLQPSTEAISAAR